MFESEAWESDKSVDHMTKVICQKLTTPKKNKKVKKNLVEKVLKEPSLQESEKFQHFNGKSEERSNRDNVKNRSKNKSKININVGKGDSNSSTLKESENKKAKKRKLKITSGSNTGNKEIELLDSDRHKSSPRKPSKHNKYKNIGDKNKIVGIDAKSTLPVKDIPRIIKFQGHSFQENIDEWESKKQEITRQKRMKKKQRKKKADITEGQQDFQTILEFQNNTRKSKKRQIKVNMDKDASVNSDIKNSIKKPRMENKTDILLDKDIIAINKLTNSTNTINSSNSVVDKSKKKSKKKKGNTFSEHGNENANKQFVMSDNNKEFKQLSKVNSPFNIAKLKRVLAAENPDHSEDLTVAIQENKQPSVTGTSSKPEKKERSKKQDNLSLRDKAMNTLNAARFRYLNECLYTQTGAEAWRLFQEDPQAFSCYHTGFQQQVNKWPDNPIDRVIDYIKLRGPKLTVADFGCGEAKIAQSVQNKVHSFDLVALNEHVTACNMSSVPIRSDSVDIAVFCLSLMGTNLAQYLAEANRILKTGGVLLIAEVTSRFQKVSEFVRKVKKIGFSLDNQDVNGKMFLWFEFKKTGPAPLKDKLPKVELAPCLYKKR